MVLSTIQKSLERLKAAGLYRTLKPTAGRSVSHNDYLGLAVHPEIIEAGVEALRRLGAGSTGSRLLGGHRSEFEETEKQIAQFFEAPDSLFFSSGYLANLAVVQALAPHVEKIYSDEKNHASLIDAIRLSGREKVIVPHGQWLEQNVAPSSLAVAETLFSMDGDWLDLDFVPKLTSNSFVHLDEAHAAGAYLEQGRGLAYQLLDWSKSCVTVTFGKAFGVSGAAVLCSREVKELLINTARSFIYTTAPQPAVFAMVQKSLEVAAKESWRREELWNRALEMRQVLLEANTSGSHELAPMDVPTGFWSWRSPIIRFKVSGDLNALRFSESMGDLGFDVRAIRYPTVPKGSEQLRISVNLRTEKADLLELSERMVDRWKAFLLQEQTPE